MRSPVLVVLLSALVVVPARAADLGSEHDPGADFSGYRSYAWKVKIPEPAQDPTGDRRRLDALIRGAADAELEERGYRLADGPPDMWLVYSVVAGSQTRTRVFQGEVWEVARTAIYAEGNLVFEILDGGSGEVVWRGWARGGIKPERRETAAQDRPEDPRSVSPAAPEVDPPPARAAPRKWRAYRAIVDPMRRSCTGLSRPIRTR